MTLRERLKVFITECRSKAQQNYQDAQQDNSPHARGFADAQMWVVRNLEKIVKQHHRRFR